MSAHFHLTDSALWTAALGPRSNDPHADARSRLRNTLLKMRDHVAHLVGQIQAACPGLTVHDISHLDALWEMADLVAGSDYGLTPAEAFVFGGAVLLHDAGMSAAAFAGGEAEIRSTVEWKDSIAFALKNNLGRPPTDQEMASIPPDVIQVALFDTLRLLHASQAEKLANLSWLDPVMSSQMHLLEDHHLRLMYASSIGRVAHSHHWSLGDVQRKLENNMGAAPELPNDWILDEVKVACLLRCADICHVDHRRAPSMLYAMLKPRGYSNLHWSFQNRLKKPVPEKDYLFYDSGSPFPIEEAPAWWLCYDALSYVEAELTSTNALLADTGRPAFRVKRVYGANRPDLIATRIRPAGWTPVEAQLRVSDPAHLAQTLGGRNLYGSGFFPPVRELLQNAVDAVRARRSFQNRPESWGRVELTIENKNNESEQEVWLHVDDNGVGMSQNILTSSLLDFGRSLWTSPEVRDEFPGLAGKGFQPIGKFGIGFFSVFLLGSKVRVVSKRFNEGDDSARVLEFNSLSIRPLLRPARRDELPLDVSTRVSVKLDNPNRLILIDEGLEDQITDYKPQPSNAPLYNMIKSLMTCVNVDFSFRDELNSVIFTHAWNWVEIDAKSFLSELCATVSLEKRELLIASHADRVRVIRNSEGKVVGRAALGVEPTTRVYGRQELRVSVGGFVYLRSDTKFPGIGVIEGDTEVAARNIAVSKISKIALSNWATEQAKLLEAPKIEFQRLILLALEIMKFDGNSGDLPICFAGGKLIGYEQYVELIRKNSEIIVPLREDFDGELFLWTMDNVPPSFFLHDVLENVVLLQFNRGGSGFGTDKSRNLKMSEPVDVTLEFDWSILLTIDWGGRRLDALFNALQNEWGNSLRVELCMHRLYVNDEIVGLSGNQWVLRIWKASA